MVKGLELHAKSKISQPLMATSASHHISTLHIITSLKRAVLDFSVNFDSTFIELTCTCRVSGETLFSLLRKKCLKVNTAFIHLTRRRQEFIARCFKQQQIFWTITSKIFRSLKEFSLSTILHSFEWQFQISTLILLTLNVVQIFFTIFQCTQLLIDIPFTSSLPQLITIVTWILHKMHESLALCIQKKINLEEIKNSSSQPTQLVSLRLNLQWPFVYFFDLTWCTCRWISDLHNFFVLSQFSLSSCFGFSGGNFCDEWLILSQCALFYGLYKWVSRSLRRMMNSASSFLSYSLQTTNSVQNCDSI